MAHPCLLTFFAAILLCMQEHDHSTYYNSADKVQRYIDKDQKYEHITRDILTEFLSDLPTGGSVLDVGCGYGRDVATMRGMGFTAHGIDASQAMIDAARERYGDYFQYAALADLQNWPHSYDIVHCRNVLVHVAVADLAVTLKNLCRILKSGGTLVLISKEGEGASITHTMGADHPRETLLHSKEFLANLLQTERLELMEPPLTMTLPSAKGDPLFRIRARKA